MPAHNPSQLKHRHLRLAKHRQQPGVGVDGALISGVLQPFNLDVLPQIFDDLNADDLFVSYKGGVGCAQKATDDALGLLMVA
jgi:hypothetical protein